jgi:hypothetical protein
MIFLMMLLLVCFGFGFLAEKRAKAVVFLSVSEKE